jgi:hypothetical protein
MRRKGREGKDKGKWEFKRVYICNGDKIKRKKRARRVNTGISWKVGKIQFRSGKRKRMWFSNE